MTLWSDEDDGDGAQTGGQTSGANTSQHLNVSVSDAVEGDGGETASASAAMNTSVSDLSAFAQQLDDDSSEEEELRTRYMARHRDTLDLGVRARMYSAAKRARTLMSTLTPAAGMATAAVPATTEESVTIAVFKADNAPAPWVGRLRI